MGLGLHLELAPRHRRLLGAVRARRQGGKRMRLHPVVGDLEQGLTGRIEQVANRPVGRMRTTGSRGSPRDRAQTRRPSVRGTMSTSRSPPGGRRTSRRAPAAAGIVSCQPGVVAAGASAQRQTGARQPTVSGVEVHRHEPVPHLVTLDDRHCRAAPNGEPGSGGSSSSESTSYVTSSWS